jgi:hypothetical protein
MMFSKLMRWAKMPFQCEVFNMFAHLIPQQGLSRMERGRKRPGKSWFLTFSLSWMGRGGRRGMS